MCENHTTFPVRVYLKHANFVWQERNQKLYLISIIITRSFLFSYFLSASFQYNRRTKKMDERKRKKLNFFHRSHLSANGIASISANVNEFICFVRTGRAYLLHKINILKWFEQSKRENERNKLKVLITKNNERIIPFNSLCFNVGQSFSQSTTIH